MALAILALTGCGSGGSDSTKNGPSLDTARVEEVIESNSDVIPDASVKCPSDIGLKRVHLGHILAAVGLNVLRLGEWFLNTAPANTRLTPFARLLAEAPAA